MDDFMDKTFDRFAAALTHADADAKQGFTRSRGRGYAYTPGGDVVSTPLRPGENEATLQFRLTAALMALGVTEHG